VATGVFSSMEEGVAQMVRTGPTFEPDLALHQRYMEKFQVFKRVYPALAELNHQL